MSHLTNPFRGSIDGDWWLNIVHVPEYGTISFMCDSNMFFHGKTSLIGKEIPIKQMCFNCKKHIDEEIVIFVVHRVRQIDYQSICRLSFKLDKDDVFCSKEKFPKFLEWQMEEHKKTCAKGNSIPT